MVGVPGPAIPACTPGVAHPHYGLSRATRSFTGPTKGGYGTSVFYKKGGAGFLYFLFLRKVTTKPKSSYTESSEKLSQNLLWNNIPNLSIVACADLTRLKNSSQDRPGCPYPTVKNLKKVIPSRNRARAGTGI